MKKVAILGGSFNPIHIGHIELAKAATHELNLDTVLVVPAGEPPHKDNRNLIGAEHRLAMCKFAIRNEINFEINEIELNKRGKSYTFETLQGLSVIYPDTEFYLIMGADMFLTFDKWRSPEIIARFASVITAPRDEAAYRDLLCAAENYKKNYNLTSYVLQNNVMNISSTRIRKMIESDNINEAKEFLSPEVFDYIIEKELYR